MMINKWQYHIAVSHERRTKVQNFSGVGAFPRTPLTTPACLNWSFGLATVKTDALYRFTVKTDALYRFNAKHP